MLLEKIAMYYMYYRIKNNPFLSREEIEDLQLFKLKKLIKHAYENVTYYRELMDKHNISFKDINTLDDLKKIPVSAKNNLKQHKIEDLISKDVYFSKLHKMYTSGSTLEPFEVYCTKKEGLERSIVELRCFFMSGYKAYHKIMRMGHLLEDNTNWLNKIGEFKKISVSSFTPIDEQIELAKKFKPDVISSYPTCLKLLALEVKKRNINFIKPKMMFTGAEVLYDEDRRLIESTFDSKIYNIYATWEFGRIAFECSNHSGLHINEDFFIVEYLDTKNKNEKEIVVTSLLAHKMPFIRYKLNDLVEIGDDDSCNCGIKFRRIKKINGRLNNYFFLQDGRKFSALYISYFIENNIDYLIKQFKIVQHSKEKLEIIYIRDKELTDGEKTKINNAFEKYLGKITLELTKKDRIPFSKSGKYSVFESKLT